MKRIAFLLDGMQTGKSCVIVPNALKATVRLSEMQLKGPSLDITFSSKRGPYLRSMQEIDKPEELIGDVLKAIDYVFTVCPNIIVKLLTSQKGDISKLKIH